MSLIPVPTQETQGDDDDDDDAPVVATDRTENEGFFSNRYVMVFVMMLSMMFLGMPLGFVILFLSGPTMMADAIFFYNKKNALVKELNETAVPVVGRIVSRHPEFGYSVHYGFELGNQSYITRDRVKVPENVYKMGFVRLFVSPLYPTAGDQRLKESQNYGCFSNFCSCIFGMIATAFVTFFWGTILTTGNGISGYFWVAGVLSVCGILAAYYLFNFWWKRGLLSTCKAVSHLPLDGGSLVTGSNGGEVTKKGDKDSRSEGDLELPAIQGENETVALTEDCASVRSVEVIDVDARVAV